VLEEILPSGVATVATRSEISDAPLFPSEEIAIGRAVEKRRREFVTARACARAALERLGIPPQAIPPGPKGEPQWPPGVVGSIAHCRGYRVAAVARKAEFATVGIDAEPDEPLPEGVLGDIALPEELRWLRAAPRRPPGVSWDRLLFCAKEAVYKAWFPLTGRWLGFEDAVVTIDAERRRFTARLLVPGPELGGLERAGFAGRWLARDGLVIAAIAPTVREFGA